MDNKEKTMDKIVALCKNRGFVFPGSEIALKGSRKIRQHFLHMFF